MTLLLSSCHLLCHITSLPSFLRAIFQYKIDPTHTLHTPHTRTYTTLKLDPTIYTMNARGMEA
jgi:hypothetical protein